MNEDTRVTGMNPAHGMPYDPSKVPVVTEGANLYRTLPVKGGFVDRCVLVEINAATAPHIADETVARKPFPKVGETCYIRHQVKRTSTGDVLGVQRADGKPVAVRITAVYLDGTVRTGNSDTWDVKPSTNRTWETVNPLHAGN